MASLMDYLTHKQVSGLEQVPSPQSIIRLIDELLPTRVCRHKYGSHLIPSYQTECHLKGRVDS